MAFSLRKRSDHDSVGLDIDDRFLAAVVVSGGVIQRAASTDLPEGLVHDGEVVDPPGLADAIKRFVSDHKLPRNVRLGVSNQQIVVRMIELPPIEDPTEREAAVRFQAAEAIAMPLDEAILDHQLIERVSVTGGERDRMVVVAARKSMIDQLLEASRAAGLKVEGIDLNAFALVRTLTTARMDSDSLGDDSLGDDARVYCHLGGMTNLAIAVGSTCVFTRPLTTSGDPGDADIASSLAEKIRLSIDFHLNLPGARTVADVVLSGPGAQQEGLLHALNELIGHPVTAAEPLGTLGTQTVAPGEDPHRYTVAAGLALGAA
jgi:type IV pilus assembly protein PilM